MPVTYIHTHFVKSLLLSHYGLADARMSPKKQVHVKVHVRVPTNMPCALRMEMKNCYVHGGILTDYFLYVRLRFLVYYASISSYTGR